MTDAVEPVEDFDCIIIGGGINGCGTFRDLCLQGVRTLLIEREDFCAGASQASSRLMHGGLKYLETGEFRLVRESLRERNMLLATAPHVVEPLECLVPVRSTWGGIVPSAARFFGLKTRLKERGLLITALGLRLYDLYARALPALPRSRIRRRARLRREMPDLHPAITGGGLYHEGHITHAERLGLELILDGEAACPGSAALNHASLLGAAGGVLTVQAGPARRRARAPIVINAGGAWIDSVNAALGLDTRLMGGSKGSHLVVDNARLRAALAGRMVYFGTPDGRVNLVYPFAGHVLIGATDIAVPDPDTARCEAEEEAYLCAAVAEVFPAIPITADQIVARFCGVRPLPRADGDIGAVTRDHAIATLTLPGADIPVLCLIGGKWTTFRAFAEQATDLVLAHLGRARRQTTEGLAIGGGSDFPREAPARARLAERLARTAGIDAARADVLLGRYGSRATDYAAALGGQGETPIAGLPGYAREELAYLAAHERVDSVDDLLRRRTLVALQGLDTPAVRAIAAEIIAAARTRSATHPPAPPPSGSHEHIRATLHHDRTAIRH